MLIINDCGPEEDMQKMLEDFQKDWDSAIKCFEKADSLEDHFDSRNTTPSSVYINRCTMFKQNPPDDDWDGVWAMTSK